MSLSSLSTLKIKVSAGSSIRRATVKAPVSFASVVVVLEKLLDLAPGQKFVVKYVDDENELITISTEEDLQEAVNVMADSGANSLKLNVVFPGLEDGVVDSFLDKKSVTATGDAPKKVYFEDDPKLLAKKEKILKKIEAVEGSSKKEEVKVAKTEKLRQKLEKLEAKVEKASSEKAPSEKAPSTVILEEKSVPVKDELPVVAAKPDEVAPVVHVGFGCNVCGIKPIVGKRFRCTACFDYDLCEACEALGDHPIEHTLVMHKTALSFADFAPFAAAAGPAMHFFRWEDKAEKPWKRFVHKADKADRAEGADDVEHAKVKKEHRKGGRRGHGCHGYGHGSGSSFCAKFIRDATLEKGAVVERDSLLVKTWAVQNDGESAWPDSVKLVYISGDSSLLFDGQREFAVPAARVNQVVDVSAVLKAPAVRGRYKAGFRLVDHEGKQFGHSLWIDIIVV